MNGDCKGGVAFQRKTHMKLTEIAVSNYRSIENLSVECLDQEGSSTFGLIGLNEAGKSSILKAIAMMGGGVAVNPKDFFQKQQPIEVEFFYELDDAEIAKLHEFLGAQEYASFDADDLDSREVSLASSYKLPELKRELILSTRSRSADEGIAFLLPATVPRLFHEPIFWTAEDRYLISRPIELTTFATNPEAVSVPLRNCFLLAGIDDIKGRVAALQDDSTEIEHLQSELGQKVTEHIKTVWPNHPIEITFLITNNQINFHVKDIGAKGRAKTADQRSDGFKQFVSFLLTVSAQNKNEELSNSILLLDEPETHLHPLAQEYLLGELIKITSNKRQNLAFFATHSNYLIDKRVLSRNFRVTKKEDKTILNRLDRKASTYASVSYEVFEIASSDYHDELYSRLHESYMEKDPADEKRASLKNFDENYLGQEKKIKKTKPYKGTPNAATLPTYIRNCIHHPEGGNQFTELELRESIELMRKM